MVRSLVYRFLLLSSVAAAVAVILVGATAGFAARAVLEREYRREIDRVSRTFQSVLFGDFTSIDDAAESILAVTTDYSVALVDTEGGILASNTTAATLPSGFRGLLSSSGPASSASRHSGILRVVTATTVPLEGFRCHLLVWGSYSVADGIGPAMLTVLFAAALTHAAMIVLILHRLTAELIIPLASIADTVRRWTSGDFTAQIRPGRLIETNEMARELRQLARVYESRILAIGNRRALLDGVLSNMVEGILVIDWNGRIVMMNDACGALFQVDASAAMGKTVVEHIRNSELDKLVRDTSSSSRSMERSLTLYQDPPVHVQAYSSILRASDQRLIGTLVVINDVTRLGQLERVRREFVANVSHELKTPITSIAGFVETLLEAPPDTEEERRRFLEIVHGQASRLNLIIEDLLSLSRLEQNGSWVEMADLLQTISSTRFWAPVPRRQTSVESLSRSTARRHRQLSVTKASCARP
jgi:PAS domain-containing protein